MQEQPNVNLAQADGEAAAARTAESSSLTELEALARNIVRLHVTHGSVLTADIEHMGRLLDDIDTDRAASSGDANASA